MIVYILFLNMSILSQFKKKIAVDVMIAVEKFKIKKIIEKCNKIIKKKEK